MGQAAGFFVEFAARSRNPKDCLGCTCKLGDRRHRVTLVHGDYSPKNILVHEGRLMMRIKGVDAWE
jgi:hypothetical protein